ncbi:polysaccharide lyase [Nitrosomonas aestuarii]|uniref:polysaccharide lyase n=1 Tax=Nitrosomonas aestuarii TaxID=52441 RepID=UPI000D3162D0|nr:hypothetical protein [Nitrosomonas aestuarii]PTN11627.1 hypothetical protein C8R11_10846 [Nitrosomonas aestuarii]
MYRLNITLILLFLTLNAQSEVYWSQGSKENRDGANFIFSDASAKLLWRRQLGDWIDRNGELYGNAAFSITHVQDLDTARKVSLDLTSLVKYWIKNPDSYHGVYLKEESGKGTIVFESSEVKSLEPPHLTIQTSQNETKTYKVTRDTALSTTSHRSLGHDEQLLVGSNTPALIAIDDKFLALDNTEITHARLNLTTTTKQFGDTQIGVFAIAPLQAPGEIERGIAWDYPADQNLAEHPDVIIAEQFNAQRGLFNSSANTDWQSHLDDTSGYNNYRIVDTAYDSDRFKPLDGSALQIEFNQKTNYGFTGHYRFKNLIGHEPEQMYFRYYLRFGDNWRPTDGGKLPGFAGTYNTAGWGGRAVDGYNGWSARGLFFLEASSNSTFEGAIPLGNYVYHPDSNTNYGENVSWNSAINLLQKNRWYAIEQYLKLNDPDKSNGQLTVWIDGKKVLDKTDFRFRKTDQLKIENLWLNFYHGGIDKPRSTFYLYIDNLVIATRYIGPMKMNHQ